MGVFLQRQGGGDREQGQLKKKRTNYGVKGN